jgi:hypothetical protein
MNLSMKTRRTMSRVPSLHPHRDFEEDTHHYIASIKVDPNILVMCLGVEQDNSKYKWKWGDNILRKNMLLADKQIVQCHPPKKSKIDTMKRKGKASSWQMIKLMPRHHHFGLSFLKASLGT